MKHDSHMQMRLGSDIGCKKCRCCTSRYEEYESDGSARILLIGSPSTETCDATKLWRMKSMFYIESFKVYTRFRLCDCLSQPADRIFSPFCLFVRPCRLFCLGRLGYSICVSVCSGLQSVLEDHLAVTFQVGNVAKSQISERSKSRTSNFGIVNY